MNFEQPNDFDLFSLLWFYFERLLVDVIFAHGWGHVSDVPDDFVIYGNVVVGALSAPRELIDGASKHAELLPIDEFALMDEVRVPVIDERDVSQRDRHVRYVGGLFRL